MEPLIEKRDKLFYQIKTLMSRREQLLQVLVAVCRDATDRFDFVIFFFTFSHGYRIVHWRLQEFRKKKKVYYKNIIIIIVIIVIILFAGEHRRWIFLQSLTKCGPLKRALFVIFRFVLNDRFSIFASYSCIFPSMAHDFCPV